MNLRKVKEVRGGQGVLGKVLQSRLQRSVQGQESFCFDRWLWKIGDDEHDQGLLIINTGGTFSSGNMDPSKGWGPANHKPEFKIEDEILAFLSSHDLLWDAKAEVVPPFIEDVYRTRVDEFLNRNIWDEDLDGTVRQLLKYLGLPPSARDEAIALAKEHESSEAKEANEALRLIKKNDKRLADLYVQNAKGLHKKEYFEAAKKKHGASFHPPTLGLKVGVESLEKTIDSSDSNPTKWNELAQKIMDGRKRGFSAFVVIHGTDTLSYTAAALSFILENFDLPVIITGSQVPWVKKGVLCDAQNNLIGAVLSAIWRFGDLPEKLRDKANGHFWSAVNQYFRQDSISRKFLQAGIAKIREFEWKENPLTKIPTRTSLRGVYVFFDNKLMLGTRVVKSSSTSFDAFTSANAFIVGSKSGGGHVHIDAKTFVEREIFDVALRERDHVLVAFSFPRYCPPVQVIRPGCKVQMIKLFPGVSLDCYNFARTVGVVFVTFGTGNGPEFGQDMSALVSRIPVVYVSECLAGGTADTYATSFESANRGTIRLHDASVEAAYAKLCCVLSTVDDTLDWSNESPQYPQATLKKIKRLMKLPSAAEFGGDGYVASSDKARMNV